MIRIPLQKKVDSDVYEIKSVHEIKSMSDETPCFDCVLFKNGVKFARVSNEGHGGPDNFYDSPELDSLPYVKRSQVEGMLTFVVYELLDLRETVELLKRKEKNYVILRKNNDYFFRGGWKRGGKLLTLAQLTETREGSSMLAKCVADAVREGYETLNTNLPIITK